MYKLISSLSLNTYVYIFIPATEEIVVYGTNVEKYSNDAFLGFPVDVLGNSYYAVSHYPTDYEGEILVVGVYDSTNVTITLGTHSEINVKYNRNRYYSNDVIEVSLNRLDTFQVMIYFQFAYAYMSHNVRKRIFLNVRRTKLLRSLIKVFAIRIMTFCIPGYPIFSL